MRRHPVLRGSRLPAHRLLLLLSLVVLTACGGAAVPAPGPTPSPRPRHTLPPPELRPVKAQTPTIQARVADGVSASLLRSVGTFRGVEAATAVSLSQVVAELLEGESLVSVVAVDPLRFRRLAPQVSADENFIWNGLERSQIFLAHEEHDRLGVNPGEVLPLRGPNGTTLLRVGGVAANGVPNLAGAMISLDRGTRLGLSVPTLLLVAVSEDADTREVMEALREKFPEVDFQLVPRPQRAYLEGPEADELLRFEFTTNEDGTITPDPNWVRANIVTEAVPILGDVRCHKLMIPQLRAALQEIVDEGLTASVKPEEYGGCYVARFIDRDPEKPLSMHAWGLAADINTASNPQGSPSRQDPQMVAILESWGFRWGGRWSPPDAHHFELAALVRQKR